MAGPFDFLIKVGMDISGVQGQTGAIGQAIHKMLGGGALGNLGGMAGGLALQTVTPGAQKVAGSIIGTNSDLFGANVQNLMGGGVAGRGVQAFRQWSDSNSDFQDALSSIRALGQNLGAAGIHPSTEVFETLMEAKYKQNLQRSVGDRSALNAGSNLQARLPGLVDKILPSSPTENGLSAAQQQQVDTYMRNHHDLSRAEAETRARAGRLYK